MFKRNGGKHLSEHQLSSYNDFITRDLSKMLTNHDPTILSYDYDEDRKLFNYEIEITFGKYMLKPPKIYENDGVTKIMYPNEARLRNFSYWSKLLVDVNIKTKERKVEGDVVKQKTLTNILIGKIPTMVNSMMCSLTKLDNVKKSELNECKYDLGGYFIINGGERVIISQERTAGNQIHVFKQNKAASKYTHIAEVKSVDLTKAGIPKSLQIKYISKSAEDRKRCIKASIPHIRQDVPVYIV